MGDYSATPLWRKLGIQPGDAVRIVDAPAGFAIDDLPDCIRVDAHPSDMILLFCLDSRALAAHVATLGRGLTEAGGFWIGWPKKSSSLVTDVDFTAVQRAGLDIGLVDNKSCAIDADWQALRFVRRLRDRGVGKV